MTHTIYPDLPMSEIEPDISAICAWLASSGATGLSADSRTLPAGAAFFAFPVQEPNGRIVGDGRHYLANAIEQGASAVLFDPDNFVWPLELAACPHRAVPALAHYAGAIANAFHQQPDSAMLTVAVTGTNGKTSCALWLGRAFSRIGSSCPAAVIGTLGVAVLNKGDGEFTANGYTTPDAILLQNTLHSLRSSGVQALAMEASSIGLEQGRMNGMHVDIALFTNLTRDHLDFHGDMAAYEVAKNRLFDWPGLRHAVVNLDDAMGPRLVKRLAGKVPVTGYRILPAHSNPANNAQPGCLADFAADLPADLPILYASGLRTRSSHNVSGTEFTQTAPQGAGQITCQVKTRLLGQFNISNALGVLGVMLAAGIELGVAVKALEALEAAPGRMQSMGGIDAPLAVIDYAHTPDALEKTLQALRPVCQERGGQLWCVFGCGGDRDPGKRPQMGKIAELADQIVVTSDNPRSEEPQAIIGQILAGISKPAQAID
ncbi:MAG: hypothetical protein RL748_3465, partial [Pseudomonadota bacterium]